MRKTEIFRYLLMFLFLYSTVNAQQQFVFYQMTHRGWSDYEEIATPSPPTAGTLRYYVSNSTHNQECVRSDGSSCTAGSVPSGSIISTLASACPSGFTESATLNGKTQYGTVIANGDVGTTGGSDSVTPTVASLTAAAQTFTGNSTAVPAPAISWPVGVPSFSGTPFTSVINHTHTITSTLTVQGGTTAAITGTHVMTSTATGGSARAVAAGDSIASSSANPSGGVASITPAGSVAWPAGVPTNSSVSITPLGHTATSAVTGTLNSFDNRGAYVKVIFCTKV